MWRNYRVGISESPVSYRPVAAVLMKHCDEKIWEEQRPPSLCGAAELYKLPLTVRGRKHNKAKPVVSITPLVAPLDL